MKIEIEKVSVLIRKGHTDHVIVCIKNCPYPFEKFSTDKSNLDMQFEAPRGKGVEYVRKYFNVEPKIIDGE